MHASWFNELDVLLAAHQTWWQFRPFHQSQMPWSRLCPGLTDALNSLDDDDIGALDVDMAALVEFVTPWIPSAPRLLALSQLPLLPHKPITLPSRADYQIPGRKLEQILAFISASSDSCAPRLEWCAGKGHLGRLLSLHHQCGVCSLEWQHSLCREGEVLARRQAADQQFVCVDVFDNTVAEYLSAERHVVALHACGDLHTDLITRWNRSAARELTLSPCCYHLTRAKDFYQPLSQVAKQARVRLTKADLSLPLQETVTAGRRERSLRDQQLHWRLAFDLWQRFERGVDEYLPLPTIRAAQLAGSFTEFALGMAHQKQLSISNPVDDSRWLEQGLERLKWVRRMELVTHVFRRPLEVWLALDRVLCLEEAGAAVSIGQFCDRRLTPRNIMIRAIRV